MRRLSLILPLLMAGCHYPTTTVATVEAYPALRITGASPTAALVIDNQTAGPARMYGEGGQSLVVAHGTHHVEIRDGGALVFSGDVYFGDNTTKTISVTPGTP